MACSSSVRPTFTIQLPKAAAKTSDGKAIQDLTAHPWAGLMVELTVLARDHAGQTGESKPKRFKLPEREFTKPLAKSLVEFRRELVMSPDDRDEVIRLLEALTVWPEGVLEDSGVYLGVRTATESALPRRSRTRTSSPRSSSSGRWRLPSRRAICPRRCAISRRRARRCRRRLPRGAPPEKIAELMQRLREALDRYLERHDGPGAAATSRPTGTRSSPSLAR